MRWCRDLTFQLNNITIYIFIRKYNFVSPEIKASFLEKANLNSRLKV
jgi:hypothetical protein